MLCARLFIAPVNCWQPLIFLPSPLFCLFTECHRVGRIHYGARSDWLLSLRNMHLRSFPGFSWLGSLFLSAVNNISIHPLKDSWAASKSWQLWRRAYFLLQKAGGLQHATVLGTRARQRSWGWQGKWCDRRWHHSILRFLSLRTLRKIPEALLF